MPATLCYACRRPRIVVRGFDGEPYCRECLTDYDRATTARTYPEYEPYYPDSL